MMRVRSMLTHVLAPKINQINKIKHSPSVSLKTKKTKNTICKCNFNGKSVFRCTLSAITQRRVINPNSDFDKSGLKLSARLKGISSRSFSAKK